MSQPYYVKDIIPNWPDEMTIHGAWSHRTNKDGSESAWSAIRDHSHYGDALKMVAFGSNDGQAWPHLVAIIHKHGDA